ncbi:aldo/keto reductase [Rhodococcus sp. IEGM 1354]|uniref:aldo/keto reductase n=1 Tax=Rhodococcus sp. IEGM 1354 TaxID=3047088 RepID=UPI0024B65904|nr:aldo/keto reductase [Rhodococcus sp. IEGM 1354]MDI9928892.1 aldo/keto reductase [Rhodococcus sp. IEGM 1354]
MTTIGRRRHGWLDFSSPAASGSDGAQANVVVEVAAELGATPAQVAMAWTLHHPAVVSSLIGVRTAEQLQHNIGALDVVFDETQLARLQSVSAIDMGFPHEFLARPMVRGVTSGRTSVRPRPPRSW